MPFFTAKTSLAYQRAALFLVFIALCGCTNSRKSLENVSSVNYWSDSTVTTKLEGASLTFGVDTKISKHLAALLTAEDSIYLRNVGVIPFELYSDSAASVTAYYDTTFNKVFFKVNAKSKYQKTTVNRGGRELQITHKSAEKKVMPRFMGIIILILTLSALSLVVFYLAKRFLFPR